MKKTVLFVAFITAFLSCNSVKRVKISGTINGLSEKDSILTIRGESLNKSLSINSKGEFKDEFEVTKPGTYNFSINQKVRFPVFLRNGYNLAISGDASKMASSLNFTGNGSETNVFISETGKVYNAYMKNYQALLKGDKKKFIASLDKLKADMNRLMDNEKVDTIIKNKIATTLKSNYSKLEQNYNQAHAKKTQLVKGEESPQFYNLENYKGGTTSMSDLKGKYIYIDVWATWCRPCVAQIPSLIQLEEEYRGKNIEFVSISTDRANAHDKWKKMIVDKGMAGTQLFMGKDRSFMQSYQIRGIPRFIFVGPNGEIVNPNAPRPSQTKAVKKMFAEVGL